MITILISSTALTTGYRLHRALYRTRTKAEALALEFNVSAVCDDPEELSMRNKHIQNNLYETPPSQRMDGQTFEADELYQNAGEPLYGELPLVSPQYYVGFE